MNGYDPLDLLDPPTCSLLYREAAISKHRPCFPSPLSHFIHLDDAYFPFPLHPFPHLSVFDFAAAADFIRDERAASLHDRIAALELGLCRDGVRERKYKWTAEITGLRGEEGFDRKYKWAATVRGGVERDFKLTAEIRGKGKDSPRCHSCTIRASVGKGAADKGKEKSVAEIEHLKGGGNHHAFRQIKTSAKRASHHYKGKRKELCPQDAALLIQTSFRSHRVQRTQVINGLRDLAIARAKLKEIKALFANFSYRRRIANDAEERQRFSEKIIVLLLTVDAIEGSDLMVRAARKSMLEELDAMLEVVDPQPHGKLGTIRRRKFDLPAGGSISKEMELGVAEVVQMLDQEDTASNLLQDVS